MRVVFAGGGTGGHLMPALAIATALRRRAPGADVLFVGTAKGIEVEKVPAAGWELRLVPGGPVKGVGPLRAMRNLASSLRGVARAWRMLGRPRADVVVCVGGYASFAAGVAAWLRRIPVVVLEQNAVPGRTNRLLSRFAALAIAPFDAALARLHGRRREVCANPVRPELVERFAALRAAKTDGAFHLFVFGGSQGARRLNEATREFAAKNAPRIGRDLVVTHQTGRLDFDAVSAFYRERNVAVDVRAFIDDMAEAYARCDLVVCRAGATSIAELAALGLPGVLVPYPFAADDHQRANAAALVEAGAARAIDDAALDADSLAAVIDELGRDRARLAAMAEAARRLGRPDAADHVAMRVLDLGGLAHVS